MSHANGMNVLVVEDNPDGANSLACLLTCAGHTVRIAGDGFAAIEEAFFQPPDAAILDIGIPGRDGWEVAKEIRATLHGRHCFHVALSGHDDFSDREHSREVGINLHLRKPADPQLLLELLDKYHTSAQVAG